MTEYFEGDTVLHVGPEHAGTRLDLFVCHSAPAYSRVRIKTLLREGRVLVNGRAVHTGVRLAAGDVVTLRAIGAHAEGELPLSNPRLPLVVVYESSAVLVVDKPAGMPSAPLAPHETGTLVNALVARYPELRGVGYRTLEAGLLHRLDTETSGLLLIARAHAWFDVLKRKMNHGEIKKTYLALVHGVPPAHGVVDLAVAHDPHEARRMRVVLRALEPENESRTVVVEKARARPATTCFRVLARGSNVALLEVHIERGARHQIRVHLASQGFPLAGDALYAPPRDPNEVSRHFLHASRLDFVHPQTGEPCSVSSRLPEELLRWLDSVGIGRDSSRWRVAPADTQA